MKILFLIISLLLMCSCSDSSPIIGDSDKPTGVEKVSNNLFLITIESNNMSGQMRELEAVVRELDKEYIILNVSLNTWSSHWVSNPVMITTIPKDEWSNWDE